VGYESDEKSLAAVRDGLSALLPRGVAVAVWGLDTQETFLLEAESQAISRAVESRRQEFARGRACARHALESLGVDPIPLGVGPGRQPLWPEGFVGSITHGADVVAAVVASADNLSALGIDVETVEVLSESVRQAVVQPEDQVGEMEETGKVLFSAKESVFKALYPLSGVWMDFDAVALTPGPAPKTLRARPTGRSPAPSSVAELLGGYRIIGERVVTAFWRLRA